MRVYRTSCSFDLFQQHCLLPEFTPNQYASEVCDELIESIQNMKKSVKTQLLKKMAKALRTITTAPAVFKGWPFRPQKVVVIRFKG